MRKIFFICFLLVSVNLFSQEVNVTKSEDVVVIQGNSYYLHIVQEKETLFSIGKAYGVDVDIIKRINNRKDNNLSLFDVLKIPVVEAQPIKDDKYYYHRAERGETIYSISRKYDIKARRILRENPIYEKSALGVGDIVKLPLKEITISSTGISNIDVNSVKDTEVERGEGGEIIIINTQTGEIREHIPDRIKEQEDTVRSDFYFESYRRDDKEVKVGVVLPLYITDNVAGNLQFLSNDTLRTRNATGRLVPQSEQFIYFYEGLLMALDSLKKNGYKVDLYVFDTYRNNQKVEEIARRMNTINPDIIIGPVYNTELKVMASQLLNNRIPLVYPLSARSEDFCKYPNFIQVNPSFSTLLGEIGNWMQRESRNSNLISFSIPVENTEYGLTQEASDRLAFHDRIRGNTGITVFDLDIQKGEQEFRDLLVKDKENIIFIPSTREAEVARILPILYQYSTSYPIKLIGLPDWQNFTSIDLDVFYKLNMKMFTYSYIENFGEEAQNFAAIYRKYFNNEPHTLTNKAYDMALYFIPLAAKYKTNTLDYLNSNFQDGIFSRFRFSRMCEEGGYENKGLYIVNFYSNYTIEIEKFN